MRTILLAVAVAFAFTVFGVGQPSSNAQTSASQVDQQTTTQILSAAASVDAHAGEVPSHSDKTTTHAETGANAHSEDGHAGHAETFPKVLLLLLIILIVAKLGGDLFERIGQPAVLGELLFGIILGNLSLLRLGALDGFVNNVVNDPQAKVFLTLLSEIGVVLLLFEVGLESTVREMISVGASALAVATLGVVAPMALGFLVGKIFLPAEPWTVHMFIGAVLAATSVGITARVLKDIGKMQLRESKIILGAAVIDDILGLVVLAVAQGVIAASNTGGSLSMGAISIIVIKAVGFFVVAIGVGMLVSRKMYKTATYLHVHGVLLAVTLAWCFFIAYIGTLVGVAPIVGAFAAGLVLEDATFEDWDGGKHELEDLIRPLTSFLVPVFFVNTGMNVDLSTFANPSIIGFAAALTFVAFIGKQICSLGVLEKGLNKLAIGIGMVPRGEVGLIIANIGRTMKTPEGHPVISTDTFSAAVIMVVLTTMVTPPLLKWALERKSSKPDIVAG